MPASIRTTRYVTPGGAVVGPILVDTSRDDLRTGNQIICESVFAGTTYNWTLVFAPESAGPESASSDDFEGTPSAAALINPPGSTSSTCKFNVDWDGSYLIRLVVDAGLPTEATAFIRCRALTRFGDLFLVAAGERRDSTGSVPVDASTAGWASIQNRNVQRLLAFVRRTAVSGRVLYVDANRGRDSSATPDDPTNILRLPGSDPAARDESGIRAAAEGFGDFSSIGDAITYAAAAASRGEPAPSTTDPYWILIAPGYYEEVLTLQPNIHLMANPMGPGPESLALAPGAVYQAGSVIIRATTGSHALITAEVLPDNLVYLGGLSLEGTDPGTDPALAGDGGILLLDRTTVWKNSTQGAGYSSVPGSVLSTGVFLRDSVIASSAAADAGMALGGNRDRIDATNSTFYGATGIVCNQGMLDLPVDGSSIHLDHCTTWVQDANGAALNGYPRLFEAEYSTFLSALTPLVPLINIDPQGQVGTVTFNLDIRLQQCSCRGDVAIDGTGTTGTVYAACGATILGEDDDLTVAGTNVTVRVQPMLGDAVWHRSGVAFADSPYNVLYLDRILGVNTGGGPISIRLPQAPQDGRVLTIKDEQNNAVVNNITVTAAFGDTIHGAASYIMNVNRQAVTLYYNSGTWQII